MRIISIANQKGGCGKTTTAINLSACLAYKDRKVLLIDMDPQGHSAVGLAINPSELNNTVFEALCDSDNQKINLDDVIIEIAKNLHLAPSNIALSTFGQRFYMAEGRQSKLHEAIACLSQPYDYVIIDCPPSLGLLTFNALVASKEVIVPIEMSLFSLHGISKLLKIIDLVREKTGHNIRARVLATLVDRRTRISREVLEDIRLNFNETMLSTIIHQNVKLKEAAGFGKSIVDFNQNTQGFNDYMSMAKEIVSAENQFLEKPIENHKTAFSPAKIIKQFSFHDPDADSVKIAGNFNNWSTSMESDMARKKNGIWSKQIVLEPGTYQYRFLVDGEWIEDRNNSRWIKNDFGTRNSVLKVP